MTQTVVENDDIRWLKQHSKPELTMIVGQMTSLMEAIADTKHNTDALVAKLQNQGWFKRLWNSITGKNKATKKEIRQNQDKIVAYISQAVAKLVELGLIERQAIQSLGNRINQVYAQLTEYYNEQLYMKAQITEIQEIQNRTIQLISEIASKLDEKIESVDNYFMLRAEIEQGKYKNKSRIYAICSVLSQLDKRTINDERKIEILKIDLKRFKIIPSKKATIKEYLSEILSLSEAEVGIIYLELCNYRKSFPANIIVETIEEYHFLSRFEKMSKKKKTIINNILDNHYLEGNAVFTYSDIFENFIENRVNSAVGLDELEMNSVPSTPIDRLSSNLRQEELSFPIHEEDKFKLYYEKRPTNELRDKRPTNVIRDYEFVYYIENIHDFYEYETIQLEPFIGIKILCKDNRSNTMGSAQRIAQVDQFLGKPIFGESQIDSITGCPGRKPHVKTGFFLRETQHSVMSNGFWLISLPFPRSVLGVQIKNMIRTVQRLKQIGINQIGYTQISVSGNITYEDLYYPSAEGLYCAYDMCMDMMPDNLKVFADHDYNYNYNDNDNYKIDYSFYNPDYINTYYRCFKSRWKLNPNDPNLYKNISDISLHLSEVFRSNNRKHGHR